MAMHGAPYVATATLSHLEDFAKKLKKAKEKVKDGFVYLHIFAPCVMGWRIEPSASIKVCRMAVRSNYYPLWEAENGNVRLTHEVPNPQPVGEYLKMVRKFSHLGEDDIKQIAATVNRRYTLLKGLDSLNR